MTKYSVAIIAALFFHLTYSAPAWAEPFTYQPEHCEFTITFPEKPIIKHQCDDEAKTKCYDQLFFTQVYAMDASASFTALCSNIDAQIKESYGKDVILKTLAAMTKDKVIQHYESNYHEEEKYKLASLLGEGMKGMTPSLYLAQLWIGEKSAFSFEAELIGESHKDGDKLFHDILQSMRHVTASAPDPSSTTQDQKQ